MFRDAYGGRGSAKTRSFAKMAAVRAMMWAEEWREGIILCGREFRNSLADSSFAEVKAAIASATWLADYFDVGETYSGHRPRASTEVSFTPGGARASTELEQCPSELIGNCYGLAG